MVDQFAEGIPAISGFHCIPGCLLLDHLMVNFPGEVTFIIIILIIFNFPRYMTAPLCFTHDHH